MAGEANGRVEPVKISTDSMPMLVGRGGNRTIVFPHQGRFVWLWPYTSSAELTLQREIGRLEVRRQAAAPGPDEKDPKLLQEATAKLAVILDELADLTMQLATELARRIHKWTLRDMRQTKLPQPDGTSGPLLTLDGAGLNWLMHAAAEDPEAQGNGSKPSETGLSDTAPTKTPSGGEAPRRSRRRLTGSARRSAARSPKP